MDKVYEMPGKKYIMAVGPDLVLTEGGDFYETVCLFDATTTAAIKVTNLIWVTIFVFVATFRFNISLTIHILLPREATSLHRKRHLEAAGRRSNSAKHIDEAAASPTPARAIRLLIFSPPLGQEQSGY